MKEKTEEAKQATIQTAAASVTQTNFQQVKSWLTRGSTRDGFMEVLGEKYAPRFMQTILLLMRAPAAAALNKCDPKTIVRSAMVSACTGLSIDPNLSQSALIPYNDQCTFQIMNRGLQQLTFRTGTVQAFNTTKVYQGDILAHNPFTGEYLYNDSPHERDVVDGYMAYIKHLTGFEKYCYMTIDELRAWGQRYSKSYNSKNKWGEWTGMWRTEFEIMALKTVSKRLLREGSILDPYSTNAMNQLATAIKFDCGTPRQDVVTYEAQVEYPDGQTADAAMQERVENADK